MALAFDRRATATVSAARDRPAAFGSLTLNEFRSYARLRLEVDPRPVVLTGPNGAGKTNLLEAISFLAPGRGLRGARLAEVDRIGGGPWTVRPASARPRGAVEIGTGHRAGRASARGASSRSTARAASQAALAETASAIWLTPAMDRLFQDGAGERRRFLDRLVLAGDPAHAAQVARYGHALRERLRLLRAGRLDPPGSAPWRPAAAAGVAIAAARRQTVRGLRAARVDPPAVPAARPRAGRTIEAWLDELPALDVEARFAEALAASRRPGRRDRQHRGRPASQRSRGARPGHGPAGRRLLDRRAEGAPDRHRAGRGAPARRRGRAAADPAARRGRGPPRCRAAPRPCSSSSARSAPRPG